MTAPAERWARVKQLFHEASLRPGEERRAFLERAAGEDHGLVQEVLRLLAGEAQPVGLLDAGVGSVAESLLRAPSSVSLDPDEFLPYKLVGPLGEGGMGVVFLAQRDDLEMQVAIKILRDAWLSPARRKRFVAEQRTLAHLSHPGIARIYDAHTLADGTPWFVMEYVDGLPLNEYCARAESSVEDRLLLFRAVCEAVQYAHEHGVIHRDLKPSNILVKRDGSVRLVDFGIAKRIDLLNESAAKSRTTLALMTPAYAAPEQLRGEETTPLTDIYSLGVVLFELLTGRLPGELSDDPLHRRAVKPSLAVRTTPRGQAVVSRGATSAWADIDVMYGTAAHEEPGRRYSSVAALISDIDNFLNGTPLNARADSLVYAARRWTQRRWRALGAAVLLVTAGGVLALAAASRQSAAATGANVIAVMPFRNIEGDTALAYFAQAIPDEIATTLSSQRGISVRPFQATAGYSSDTLNLRRVGHRIGVTHIVTGRYQRAAGTSDVAIDVQLIDVRLDSVVWRDRLTLEPGNAIALQGQVANLAHGGLASSLGVATSRGELTNARPRSQLAYDLYLRSAGGRYDAGPWNQQAIRTLEEAVALDSTYAPAWLLLARRYYIESRYGSGDPALRDKMMEAARRSVTLDSNFVLAGARMAVMLIERGQTVAAYQQLQAMLRRRADSPDVHFALSYVLRFAGLLRESARECAIALSIDAHNYGWRSCAVPSMLSGDNQGALGFVNLDAGGEWSKAMIIHMLVRVGDTSAALGVERPNIPQWKSYDMLLACVARRPVAEVDSLASLVQPADDPESNYFAASHLGYCGRTSAALGLVERAIDGGYCSYPVIDTDPFFARVRAHERFATVRAKAAACQQRFLAGVARPARAQH